MKIWVAVGIVAGAGVLAAVAVGSLVYDTPPLIVALRGWDALKQSPAVFHRDRMCSAGDALRALRYGAFQRIAPAAAEHRRMSKIETASGLEKWRTPIGDFWIPPENDLDLADMLAEMSRYPSPSAGSVVIDCGANVGVFTRRALAAGARTVVAVEPAPTNILALRHTFRQEIATGRVILVAKAVWDRDGGKMPMHYGMLSSTGSLVLPAGEESTDVELTTVDRIAAELRLPGVDYIKMDIEGSEQRALAGAGHVLQTHAPRLCIAMYHLSDDAVRIPEIIRKRRPGYQAVRAGECIERFGKIIPETVFFE